MNIFKTTCERAGPTDHSIHAHRTLPYQDNGGGRLAKRNWHGRNARALRERWPCQHDSPSHAASGEVSDDMRGSARLARVEKCDATANPAHYLRICKGACRQSITPMHARRAPSWLGLGRVRVEVQAGENGESDEHAGEGVEWVGWLTRHAHSS